jgi:HAT1-interacting factor 1
MTVQTYGEEIDALLSAGQKCYALRSYEEATEKFGGACQQYSALHDGKEEPSLLFLYGRALFKVAVVQSEVLGEKTTSGSERLTPTTPGLGGGPAKPTNGLFQFSGEGEAEAEAEGEEEKEQQEGNERDNEPNEEEEDQSDFEVAWEILDLTRTLLQEQIAKVENAEGEQPDLREKHGKLADTFDLLGEISLESENFTQAVQDLEASLKLRQMLYPKESTLISEAHFKLSLAHEFDITDAESRKKAIIHMKGAIDSVKLRIERCGADDADLVTDLETRLHDLEHPDEGSDEKSEAIDGIIGDTAQNSTAAIRSQIINALNQANDISSLVRKKAPDSRKRSTTDSTAQPSSTDIATPSPKRLKESNPEETNAIEQ